MKILMAVGNKEIEEYVCSLSGVEKIETVEDMDLVPDILNYEEYDFIILNGVLSPKKTVKIAEFIYENERLIRLIKVIAIIPDLGNQQFIAQLAGVGVNGIVTFDQIELIEQYLTHYPESFDWRILKSETVVTQITTRSKMLGTMSIGVVSLTRGAGATTAAVSLAESFAQDGYAAAVIAMDDKVDLHYLNKKRLTANYVIPSTNEEKALYLTALHMEGYHFIVQDYGNLFPILADGSIKVELMKAKDPEVKEFMRCTYKVAVGFSNDWNIRKLEFFVNNDKFDLNSFFFYIQEGGNELRKYNLNLCSDYDAIADMIRQHAGLEQERKEKRPAFPFLFG